MKIAVSRGLLAGVGLLAVVGVTGSADPVGTGDAAEATSAAPSTAAGGGTCNNSTTCVFDGLTNVRLGQSLLTETGGNLFVSPVGDSGSDGVLILNSPSGFLTAHNDWIDLGDVGLGDIDEGANGPGSYIDAEVPAILDTLVFGFFGLRVEQTGAATFVVSHDFTAAGPDAIDYDVLAGNVIQCSSNGQSVASTVAADRWPTRLAFSELAYPAGTSFTLPTASCTGDELNITPTFSGPVPKPLYVYQYSLNVKRVFVFESLEPFVVTSEAFGVPAPPDPDTEGSGSGMGFSAAIPLTGPGGFPEDGTNVLALPWSRQVGLSDAADLLDDIGGASCAGGGPVVSVARYVKGTAGLVSYSGCAGTPFSLRMGEAYLVKVASDVNYRAVGLHRPGNVLTFTGPGFFPEDGTNLYAPPYHAVATTAMALIDDIGGASCAAQGTVVSIARYVKSTAGLEAYNGCSGSDFGLTHGEGYFVKVNSDTGYVPSHF